MTITPIRIYGAMTRLLCHALEGVDSYDQLNGDEQMTITEEEFDAIKEECSK